MGNKKIVQPVTVLIGILSVSATVLAISLAFHLFITEKNRQEADVEYRVYQAMSGLVDAYNASETLEPRDWPGIKGFGIYSSRGEALFSYGTAPRTLSGLNELPLGGESVTAGDTLKIVRRLGDVPGTIRRQGRQGPGRLGSPMQQSQALRGKRIAWIEAEIGEALRQKRISLLLIAGLAFLFFMLVILALYNARKLNHYRQRERQNSHLLQLGEAARILAHEIKSPLAVIRLQSGMLRRNLPENQMPNIDIIDEEAERLARLAERIRQFLDPRQAKTEILPAGIFLKDCRARYGDSLSVPESESGDYKISVNRDRVSAILDNLVSNAIEAGGSQVPLLELYRDGRWIFFSLRDYGEGISEEKENRIFELFFSTKPSGSGIGLALAKKYAEDAGGSIEYRRQKNRGSLFVFKLPLHIGEKLKKL